MSQFRCSSGHQVQLVFSDEQIRVPCPTCEVDVYKFRDAVMEQDPPALADAGAGRGPANGSLLLALKRRRVTISGAVFMVAVVLVARHRPPSDPARPDRRPVIPIEAAPRSMPGNPSTVSITHFSATPTGSGVVKLSFRLTNAGGARNGYPGLAVHWHGITGADQLISKDSYAHPPDPFTATDVTLELARPQGATGIDVKITY